MSFSEGKISPNIAGGSYSIKSKLDEVMDKLSNVYRKIKELESMMISYELNPNEIIPENLSERKDENKVITPDNYAREGIFVVSIPQGLISELAENRDIEYSLRVGFRELSETYEEQEKQKGHRNHKVSNSLF